MIDKKDIKYIEIVFMQESGKKNSVINLLEPITRSEALKIMDLMRPNKDVFMVNGFTLNNTII